MAGVEIKRLKDIEELRECERIQQAVWGVPSVSSEVLSVTQKYGGAVLGAIVHSRIVAFIYAFLARRHGQLIHWSHMMAVEPGFRDQGLGFQMKRVHRQLALQQGIRSICWTYDPLQSRNAALNLSRLGGCAEEYLIDCYGHFGSVIEKGLPTDRFVVNWRIATARVERRLEGGRPRAGLSLPRINESRVNASGFLQNRALRLALREPRLLVEIPTNTDEMRQHALTLAKRWRMETRRIFRRYFAAGYVADDLITPGASGDGRCYYVLRKERGRVAASDK
jgi:predicted GNAT superfamily acetyltransferase